MVVPRGPKHLLRSQSNRPQGPAPPSLATMAANNPFRAKHNHPDADGDTLELLAAVEARVSSAFSDDEETLRMVVSVFSYVGARR